MKIIVKLDLSKLEEEHIVEFPDHRAYDRMTPSERVAAIDNYLVVWLRHMVDMTWKREYEKG